MTTNSSPKRRGRPPKATESLSEAPAATPVADEQESPAQAAEKPSVGTDKNTPSTVEEYLQQLASKVSGEK